MKKENNVKKMRWNMKNPDSLKWYFLIGALIGAVLFVLIYGFSVLNVTNDAWLMTGKDLQQHYIGWKYYRDAAWNFPTSSGARRRSCGASVLPSRRR